MHEYVKQGGVRPAPAPEKSKLAIGLDLFTGKSVPSDLKKKDDEHHASPASASASALPRTQSATAGSSAPPAAVAVPVSGTASGLNSKTSSFQAGKPNPFASGDPFEGGDAEEDEEEEGNPFGGEAEVKIADVPPAAPPAAPAAPPAPPAAAEEESGSSNMVEALFDHEAEEEDELNFSAGDFVEVIDKPDGGWWRGRFNGKEGLFPSNYVKS